jgi:hypothetical protein
MKTKQLQRVNFEQAKRLDAIGFDYPVLDWYFRDGTFHKQETVKGYKEWKGWHCWNATKGIRFSAPTVALALKWLRDEKGIYTQIFFEQTDAGWYYASALILDDINEETVECKAQKSWDAAESALLDELLTVLEKEKNNENT